MYNAIATKLLELLGTVSSLKVVYDGEKKELKDYPAACLSLDGHNNKFSDMAANRRIVTFIIRVYYRTADEVAAEQRIRSVADDIITTIESHTTLDGVVEWAIPTTGKTFYAERELPVRGIEIRIDCVKRVVVR